MDLKNKHILITQARLFDFAGSETVTLELAEEFSRRGADVSVVAVGFGEPLIEEFDKIENVTVFTLNDPSFNAKYQKTPVDLAWIHHQIIPDIVIDNYKKTIFVFNHMSAMLGIETPLFWRIEDFLAKKIIFNSEKTLDKIINEYSINKNDSRLTILYNAAPSSFLNDKKSENLDLKIVGIVSNHPPKEVKVAARILEESHGIEVRWFGAHTGEEYKRVKPEDIWSCDAVITIGKTVQYCIVGSRPVYCYDHFGGPGYLSEENFELAMRRNFSGRGFYQKTAEDIAGELIRDYSDARNYAEVLQKRTQDQFSLEKRLDEILQSADDYRGGEKAISKSDIISYKNIRNLLVKDFNQSVHARIKSRQRQEAKIKGGDEAIQSLRAELLSVNTQLQSTYAQLHTLQSSLAFKAGSLIASPYRKLKDMRNVIQEKSKDTSLLFTYYGYKSSKLRKKQKITILVANASGPSSSAFIRLFSPLIACNRYDIEILDGVDYKKIDERTSVCIVQRVALKNKDDADSFINLLSENSIPFITDTDDAFCDLPSTHPEYDVIEPRSQALSKLMEHSRVNIFSTKRLQEVYEKKTSLKESIVVHNTLDKRLWRRWRDGELPVFDDEAPLNILYMGTPTHHSDFVMIESVLKRINDDMPGSFKLYVMGVSKDIEDSEWKKVMDIKDNLYPAFTKWISHEMVFDIGLSPLEDNEFNQNKSDIKCLDYLAIGALPVVSDVKPYETPELTEHIVRVKNTEDDWYKSLVDLINNKQSLRQNSPERIKKGYGYLSRYRSSEIAGGELRDIISKVTGNERDE